MATAIKDKLCGIYANARQQECDDYKISQRNKDSVCILDMDKIASISAHSNNKLKVSGDRCDDLVVFDIDHKQTGLYVIEKKSKHIDVSKVARQLQGSTEFLGNFVGYYPELCDQPCDFMPVLVSDKIGNLATRTKLKKEKVFLRISGRTKKERFIKHVLRRQPLPAFNNK